MSSFTVELGHKIKVTPGVLERGMLKAYLKDNVRKKAN